MKKTQPLLISRPSPVLRGAFRSIWDFRVVEGRTKRKVYVFYSTSRSSSSRGPVRVAPHEKLKKKKHFEDRSGPGVHTVLGTLKTQLRQKQEDGSCSKLQCCHIEKSYEDLGICSFIFPKNCGILSLPNTSFTFIAILHNVKRQSDVLQCSAAQ